MPSCPSSPSSCSPSVFGPHTQAVTRIHEISRAAVLRPLSPPPVEKTQWNSYLKSSGPHRTCRFTPTKVEGDGGVGGRGGTCHRLVQLCSR